MPLEHEQGTIVTVDGTHGTFSVVPESESPTEPSVRLEFPDSAPVIVPETLLEHGRGKAYRLPLRLAELAQAEHVAAVLPLAAEELHISKREVVTGGVRVTKRVRRKTETVDEPLYKEEIHIEHRPVNRVIDAPVGIRQEGETTIVPLYEESVVVTKQLILREELLIHKRRVQVHKPLKVTRRREQVIVQDLNQVSRPERGQAKQSSRRAGARSGARSERTGRRDGKKE